MAASPSNLPPIPGGRSTVMGGELQKVDLVRDELALKIPAGHTVKILFDERTQVFQNGKKISVLDLKPEDHASIETTLDGTAIFALRIHMVSDLPDGQLHGKVKRYDAGTGELQLLLADTKDAVTLTTAPGTVIARASQDGSTAAKSSMVDLVPGSLVDVTFKSGKGRPGSATKINVLAVPGDEFVFQGSLSSLDMRAGRMSIEGASDRPADIAFEPARFQVSHDLHKGSLVKVTAHFDGSRYIASDISIE